MIRAATPADVPTIINLAVVSGLFAPADTASVEGLMADYFRAKADDGHRCVLDEEGRGMAVAYFAPATATNGTWYLTMIAVRPDQQGRGRGTSLLGHVESVLQDEGQRLLLVETSGLPEFERTRQFYVGRGYEREARVRDYFEPGDDMVMFRKSLSPPGDGPLTSQGLLP